MSSLKIWDYQVSQPREALKLCPSTQKGFKVLDLERKTVVSHHPSGNIREGSRCPSLLSATTSAASFNDLSSLFKEDLRKGGKDQCLFELPLRSSTSLQARRDQYRDRLLPNPNPMNKSHVCKESKRETNQVKP